jgi:hypothetical protein
MFSINITSNKKNILVFIFIRYQQSITQALQVLTSEELDGPALALSV